MAIWAEAGSGPDKLLCHILEEQFHIILYSYLNIQQAVVLNVKEQLYIFLFLSQLIFYQAVLNYCGNERASF